LNTLNVYNTFHYLYELMPRLKQADVWFGASGVIKSRYENYVALNPYLQQSH